jgi:hypothetical protein
MATYEGRCHCGRIRFEVEGPIGPVSACNCSICTRTGYLHWPVAPERVRWIAGEGEWTSYRFGTRVADHRFCATCGISPLRIARSDPDEITVNVRCLEGIDLDAVSIARFDGRNWEKSFAAREGGR